MSSSASAAADFPRAVNADLDKGTDIVGTIVGYDRASNAFGESDIATIELEDGETVSLWLSATVLRSGFARLKPKIGERVHVSHLGKRQGATAEYKDYRVTAPDRPPYEPDWDAIGQEVDDE